MTNEEKAKEIVNYVLNPKCANGSNGLGLLNTHNQRNADLNNINKCSEEIAMRMHEWTKEQVIEKACEFWKHKFPYINIDTIKEFVDTMKGE